LGYYLLNMGADPLEPFEVEEGVETLLFGEARVVSI
jgi:hypothetical protein